MDTFIEYLNPADWSLHVINVDNEAVDEDWILVPEGAIRLTIGINQLAFWNKSDEKINISTHGAWHVWSEGVSFEDYAKEYKQTMKILWQRHTQPEELPFIDDEPSTAFDTQVGGNHYKDLKIQPMQYALENKLDYAQANVVKYVTRHASKNGKEDLLKAIHNIELMIDYYYGGDK